MNKTNNVRFGLALIVALLCASTGVSAADIAVVGPVERLDVRGASITVLGQTFKSQSIRSGRLSVGSLVMLKGERTQDGALVAASVTPLRGLYVPGANSVFLRGVVDAYDNLNGIVRIGSLKILVSQALFDNSQSVRVGDTIEVLGTQAIQSGPLWASEFANLTLLGNQGIDGAGTSIQGIEGTGKSIQGIEGTGKSAQGIEGTGKSIQGIEGTGSAQGIEGTGKSIQGIEGTGSAQGIEGTGKSIQGIEGTGSAQGIEGTGKSVL